MNDTVFMMIPEVRVCVLRTNLEFDADQALKLYRKRGTSEQHHGEFKTEMDMHLPSGKFAAHAFLRLGMLVYNMLRVASVGLAVAWRLDLKNANRLVRDAHRLELKGDAMRKKTSPLTENGY